MAMRTCPKCQRTYPDDMEYCPWDAAALVSAATGTEAELQATLAGRFRIVRRLGGGGMGTVFLAEQVAVGNRPVALKVLLRKLLDDPEFLVRFRNEAASTGRIHHANVVTIYESGQSDDGAPYIAMEYLEGESLRQALKSRGALPIEECAAIVGQVGRGLSAAHKLGIIHRDLKPDNIFLTRGDEGELAVKVVDFGIAKLRESATHTLTGMVLGTPAYMSFEQASGMRSEELDARSDIYSLGVVAYEMLTGRVPFHSDTPLGYVRKHLSEAPPPFRAVKPELAGASQIEQVVMKALEKDRDARYGSVVDFAREFAEAAQTPRRAAEVKAPLTSTKIAASAAPRTEGEVLGLRSPTSPGQAALPSPLNGTKSGKPEASPTKPEPRALAGPKIGAASTGQRAGESRLALWVGVAAVALLLGLGGWYVSSLRNRSSGKLTQPPAETQSPAANPSGAKPQAAPGTAETGAEQQGPAVETSRTTSHTPAGSAVNAADRRRRVEAARSKGDRYYENGEYDTAISSYQAGLKLDPSNAGLRQAFQRAKNAKAAEEKFSQ